MYGPFEFNENKDGPTVVVCTNYNRTKKSVSRTHVRVNGRGCALDVSAEDEREGIIAVSLRNDVQVGIGITIVYSKEIEGDNLLPVFRRTAALLQDEAWKSARLDPSSAALLYYSMRVREKVMSMVHNVGLRILIGQQVTYYWYLMRFGRITSTGAVRILALGFAKPETILDASSAERNIQSAPLSQSGAGRAQTIVERLNFIWQMRPL